MRLTKKTRKSSSDVSDTCESMPRTVPSKVIQTSIKQNYQHLAFIPLVNHCLNIKHLYLSHNKIASLQGIESYPELVSLNISYNCLTKVSELALITHPEKMIKISLRMNKFEFGYEDEVVQIFQNLRKMENEALGERKVQDQLQKMKRFISKEFIQFYKKTKMIIKQMENHEDKQNMDLNRLQQVKSTKNPISTEFMDNIFFIRLKNIYLYPTEEGLRQKSPSFLVNLCYNLINTLSITEVYTCKRGKLEDNYLEQTKDAYCEICNTILLKFSSRNDRTLKEYLLKISNEDEPITNAFGRLGNFGSSQSDICGQGIKVPKITENPSKYLTKLKNSEVINHPMAKLANWQMPNYETLIPLEQTKWYHFYKQKQDTVDETSFYEQIPIFIYCKEYLEVITEIVLNQISKILNKQHQIINKNVHCHEREILSEEIELNLSNSSIMSFGQKDQLSEEDNLQDSLDQRDFQSHGLHNKFQKQINQSSFKKSITLEKQSYLNQTKIELNLQKYTIYQINLIFKAFRSLKMEIRATK